MDKKAFNTILASVMAGAMTIGVASFANEGEKHPAKKATTAKKDAHKKGEKGTAGSCAGEKKEEHKEGHEEGHGEGH